MEIYEGYSFERLSGDKKILIGELLEYVDSLIDSNDYQESSTHYIIQCPYCRYAYLHDSDYTHEYTKKKLYVTKDKSTGYCHRCGTAFFSTTDKIDYSYNIPEINHNKVNKLVTLKDLDLWNEKMFNSFSDTSEEGLKYLIARNPYLEKLHKHLKIKFSDNNPVIPFYFHGELIYFQIRKLSGLPWKYFNPPISHKPIYPIENKDNKRLIICEGTFDAMSLLIQAKNYTPVAILGSKITDYQIDMIRTYVPDQITVFMDQTSLSVDIAKKLRSKINYAEIKVIKSDGRDPEEIMRDRMTYDRHIFWIN